MVNCRTMQNLMLVDVPLTLASSKTYMWTPKSYFYLVPTLSIITTSGFVVAMLPDRENSCRTIQNVM